MKIKVNKNFHDQIKFSENFLSELASIHIHSFPEVERKEKIVEVQNLIKNTLENIIERIPTIVQFKIRCPECGAKITRGSAKFCPYCGAKFI